MPRQHTTALPPRRQAAAAAPGEDVYDDEQALGVTPIVEEKLPYGLTPAPAVKPRTSDPVDLGDYNETYLGWKVVFDLSTDLSIFDLIDRAQNADDDYEKLTAMRQWLERSLSAWNFTHTDEHGNTVILPQPRNGGLTKCPYELLLPIARAFVKVNRPSPNS